MSEHSTAIKLELYGDELKLLLFALNAYKHDHPESTLLNGNMDMYHNLHDYLSDIALDRL